jgi:hypothetical protein
VFKLIITEVRNFPEIADFYLAEVVQPGEQLIARIVQRGIDRGEFDSVDVPCVVHSLVLPMVMLCVHKHSIGACTDHHENFDPHAFIRAHIDLVIRGLQRTKAAPRRAAAA